MHTSAIINKLTNQEFAQLPSGTQLVESFGSSYRYLRAKKIGKMGYKGLICEYCHESDKWENYEYSGVYRENFSELEPGSFKEEDFPDYF